MSIQSPEPVDSATAEGILGKAGERLRDVTTAITRSPFSFLCDAFFVAFGSWTLAWHVVYFAGGSFSTAAGLGVLVVVLTPLLVLFGLRHATETPPAERRERRLQHYLLPVFILIAVVVTLGSHRPDADDEQYLAMAISLLAHPGDAVRDAPGFAASSWLSLRYAITSYEPLKAAVSYLTGLPLLSSYYLIVPGLCAVILVLVNWRLLRLLARTELIFGFVFFLVVMIAWGDVHRTHANFGFVRLFQGKACFLSLVVPAILFYYFKWLQAPGNKYPVVLLGFALLCGVGFTPTGFIVGPLILGLLILSTTEIKDFRHPGTPVLVVGGIIVGITVALSIKWYLGATNLGVHVGGGMYVESTTNWAMYKRVMGKGVRGLFLLACVAVSFWFVLDATVRRPYRNYLFAFLVLLAIPWTSEMLAKLTYSTLSWRWFWVLPIPVLAAVTVAGLVRDTKALLGYPYALAFYLFLLVCFFAASPRWVLSDRNHAEFAWPGHKLGRDSIYLRTLQREAFVKRGRVYIEGSETGY